MKASELFELDEHSVRSAKQRFERREEIAGPIRELRELPAVGIEQLRQLDNLVFQLPTMFRSGS